MFVQSSSKKDLKNTSAWGWLDTRRKISL